MQQFPQLLIIIGISLTVVGLLWFVGAKYLNLGSLPGDLKYEGKNFKAYFPLATSMIISIILTAFFWLIMYFKK